MKILKFKKMLFFAPLLFLTSCGYGLSELVKGDAYNSINWNDNYYRVWDEKIDVHSENNKITKIESRDLNRNQDLAFYSYNDSAFKICEPRYANYQYSNNNPNDENAYGGNHNMSSINSSFKYNITSKLFDGRLFCGGNHEKARVQVAPKNNHGEPESLKDGFGRLFKKELRTADYFAMNFKCSVDYKSDKTISIPQHKCSIKIELSFFLKNDTGYTQSIVNVVLDKFDDSEDHRPPCNTGDEVRENEYMFLGFKLKSDENDHYLDISRCVGFAIRYEVLEDIYYDNYSFGHSIMLYEVMFPHSTWY